MNRPSSPAATSAHQPEPGLSAPRRAGLRDAAHRLGAKPEVAERFSETGQLSVHGKVLVVAPLDRRAQGAWLAALMFDAPAGVDESAWVDALLLANGQAIAAGDLAFALEGDRKATLMARLPGGLPDGPVLAACFEGMFWQVQAVIDALTTIAKARKPAPSSTHVGQVRMRTGAPGHAHDERGRPASGQAPSITAAHRPRDSSWDEALTLPPAAQVYLASVAAALGQTDDAAQDAARRGSLVLDKQTLSLACDLDGQTLIIAAPLDDPAFGDLLRRTAALTANAHLLLGAGLVLARTLSGPALMCRWSMDTLSPEQCAAWLRYVAFAAAAPVRVATAP